MEVKKRALSSSVLLIAASALAQGDHRVRSGETISTISKKYFPSERLYGRNGKIRQIMALNPHIKNPDLIYPKQIVTLGHLLSPAPQVSSEEVSSQEETKVSEAPQTTPEKKEEIPEVTDERRAVSSLRGQDQWNLSTSYGAKFVSVSQKGSFGSIDFGVLYLNSFRLFNEYQRNNFSIWTQLETYSFRYENQGSTKSKKLSAFQLGGTYKNILGGVSFEQLPVFRNNGGQVDMSNLLVGSLLLGMKKDFDLTLEKETHLQVKGLVSYPFTSSTDSSNVKSSSLSGFVVKGQVELEREITKNANWKLSAHWVNEAGYHQLSQTLKWDNTSGSARSTIVQASSMVGLKVSF